jgi:glycosyltransferase involved in cell wall biosynthesis
MGATRGRATISCIVFGTPFEENGSGYRVRPQLKALSELGVLDLVTLEVGLDEPAEGSPSLMASVDIPVRRHLRIPVRSTQLKAGDLVRWAAGRTGPRTLSKQNPVQVARRILDAGFRSGQLNYSHGDLGVTAAMQAGWAPLIADLNDFDAPRDLELARHKRQLRGALSGLRAEALVAAQQYDYRLARRHLRRVARLTKVSYISSPIDRDRIGAPEIRVLPNTYPEVAPLPARPSGRPFTAMYIGSMWYEPNREAAYWLVREVVPHLRAAMRDVEVRIVGWAADSLGLAPAEGVVVASNVDDMASEITLADVMVVPLRVGAGTRIKILEAFAYRVPVISTRLGAEGLDVQDKVHLLIADSAEEVVAAIASVARGDVGVSMLVAQAHSLYLERYTPRAVSREIGRAAEELLAISNQH